jgi:hypothetical protein
MKLQGLKRISGLNITLPAPRVGGFVTACPSADVRERQEWVDTGNSAPRFTN